MKGTGKIFRDIENLKFNRLIQVPSYYYTASGNLSFINSVLYKKGVRLKSVTLISFFRTQLQYIYIFLTCFRILTQGSFFLPIWPPNADKRLGPAPQPGTHHLNDMGILYIRLPDYCGKVVFPEISDTNIKAPMYEFTCLDKNTQQQLMMIVEQDPYAK